MITDLTMPKLDGIELAKAAYEVAPDLPLILASGLNEHINKNYADNTSISATVSKPFDFGKMLNTIEEVLAYKRR